MKREAYRVFEIVAWPAAAWCGLEIVLRTASGTHDGTAATVVLGAMAAATIAACRIRKGHLVPASVAAER